MTTEVALFMENALNDFNRLMQDATKFLESHRLPETLMYKAHLVLEEILTNIVKYAFDDETTHTIHVRMAVRPEELSIEFEDDGREFNPLSLPSPGMSGSIDDARVGGLGVYLVRQTVDSMEYLRDDSRNILTTRFRVKPKLVRNQVTGNAEG